MKTSMIAALVTQMQKKFKNINFNKNILYFQENKLMCRKFTIIKTLFPNCSQFHIQQVPQIEINSNKD